MSGELGNASLTLEADLSKFDKNVKTAKVTAGDLQHGLDALATVARVAEIELNKIKMDAQQGVRSNEIADRIERSVGNVGKAAMEASRHLEKVKLDASNAAETTAAGDIIDHKLKSITGNANETRRSLESVRLAGIAAGGAGGGIFDPSAGRFRGSGGRFVPGGAGGAGAGGGGNPGVGVGPFGSGFGRVGLLGAAIGGGTLLGPAAGPGALGLLASIPVLATSGAGALGTLALAFQGVFKAIGGDKKAFDDLGKSAQGFVQTVRSLDGWFDKLKETAGASLFPGLTAGLKSALSPGTLNAITSAVTQFGHAIGAAGAAWGRYFGSAEFQSIFGPLMQAGARNLGLLSSAALHLFDALGVLGRAAIPFTAWMVNGINAASRWADAFLHAKEASGALGGALNEAQTSLRLVGLLFVSLGRAVYELGAALYPVSKIAVKDLTDGFNALAGIIRRNQDGIREIVSGALAALVSTVKNLAPLVAKLAHGLADMAHAVGGWKTAFQLVIGGFLAVKFLAVADAIYKVGGRIALLGNEAAVAEGKAVGLRTALLGLGSSGVLLALAAFGVGLSEALTPKNGPAVKGFKNVPGGTGTGGSSYVGPNGNLWIRDPAGNMTDTGIKATARNSGGTVGTSAATHGPGSAHSGAANVGAGVVSGPGDFQDESPAMKTALSMLAKRYGAINLDSGYRSEAKQTALWDASVKAGHPGFMPNGNPIAKPASRGGAGSDHSRGTAADGSIFYKGKWTPLSSLPASVLQAYGLSTVPGDVGHVMLSSGGGSTSPWGTPPAFTKNLGPAAPKPGIPSGANLLPQALRDALQKAKDRATTTQGSTAAHWLAVELDDLEKARKNLDAQLASSSGKKKANIQQEIRSIDGQIASVNRQITVNLKAQATAIKQAFAAKISTAKANISSAVDALKSSLDVALGARFFQGGRTPLEQQLADMQAADQKKSLQDAITQAQQQIDSDRASTSSQLGGATDTYNAAVAAKDAANAAGASASELEQLGVAISNAKRQLDALANPGASSAQLQADQDALDMAHRQLDEYDLSIRATEERAKADKDYANAQRDLNLQITMWARGVATGATKLDDLNGIVGAFGLTLTDGGVIDDFVTLQSAVQDLAAVMIAEAQALGAIGDNKDAAAAAARAAALSIPDGAPTLIPGTKINYAGFVAASLARNQIPKLDIGGWVEQTGLAVVHRGETYSGVGGNRAGGDIVINLDGREIARVTQPYSDRTITAR